MVPDKRRVRVSAGELALIDAGHPDAPPVLLLHGFPTSSILWREYVPVLAPTFRVLVPDLLGYGDSDKPEDAALDLPAHAGYIGELLDVLGTRDLAVVGHALGGGIAQLLAVEGRARTLVLIDSVAFDAWPSQTTQDIQAMAAGEGTDALVRAVISTWLQLGLGRSARNTDTLLEALHGPFAGPDGAGAFSRAARAVDGRGLEGIAEALGGLEVPTLILWGEDDRFIPVEVAERLQDAIPTAALAVLPGCSHFVTADAGPTVATILFEFLRSRYLGRGHTHAEGPVVLSLERRPPREEGA